ncbi:hypothetical protein BX600DRAFT_538347 [Xylariales sp. PMI_506]|nr:hypothetical protein BX600DRAFT_538347 [Xylariales sp. PMI_506]
MANCLSLSRYQLWVISIAMCISISSLAAGMPVVKDVVLNSRQNDDSPPPATTPGECQTDRSDDYYGLGVRMGIYLAWFQALIAFNFVPSEIPSALDTNAIFLFAVLIAMVRCTITSLILQIDALILMHLGAGSIFGVMSIWGYRTSLYVREGPMKGISHFGGFGTHMRLLLCTAFAAYGLFFWLRGIDGHPAALISGTGNAENGLYCTPLYTFMFSRVLADGGVRVFYIICTVGSLCYWGVQLLSSSLAAYARPMKMYRLGKAGQWRTTSRLDYATGLNYKQLKYLFYFLRFGNLAWVVFSMVNIEFTLNYNRMYDVIGWRGHLFFPSQLIPLIIGVLGFLRVIYVGYEEWRSPQDIEPSLEREEPLSPQRTATRPVGRRLLKTFAPKTFATKSTIPPNLTLAVAKYRGDLMDPLLQGQPAYLRYLVSYMPWLVLVRWWHLQDTAYEQKVYESTSREADATDTRSHSRHESWHSGNSTLRGPQSPHDHWKGYIPGGIPNQSPRTPGFPRPPPPTRTV